jgi:NADH:ubiquinone oxidoreductase subunit 6 (subunit J)
MTSALATQAVFIVMTLVTLGGAIGVVTARTVFVSALWLILSFLGVAGMYVLLGAGFLAVIQILIYIGAISVLILFAVMLTHESMEPRERFNGQWALGFMLALSIFGALMIVGYSANWPLSHAQLPPSGGVAISAEAAASVPGVIKTTEAGAPVFRLPDQVVMLGRALMIEHFLAFEIISLILLVALVGAIVVARE